MLKQREYSVVLGTAGVCWASLGIVIIARAVFLAWIEGRL